MGPIKGGEVVSVVSWVLIEISKCDVFFFLDNFFLDQLLQLTVFFPIVYLLHKFNCQEENQNNNNNNVNNNKYKYRHWLLSMLEHLYMSNGGIFATK